MDSSVSTLEVYLVPIGAATYELYCETSEDDDEPTDRTGSRGMYARFREVIDQAQETRRAKWLAAVLSDQEAAQSWAVRVQHWLVSWVAEAVVDWQLLWRLRTRTAATLLHPADLDGPAALGIARSSLQRDADRHRIWLIVDGVLAGIAGPLLFFVPGPNLIAYYFVFRCVGHGLAWRGARNGLGTVVWETQPSPALADLRRTLSLDPDARARHVRDVEAQLDLQHLSAFVERILVRARRSTKDA